MQIELRLDAKDTKILAELEVNARQSNNQIAKKVGLSKEVVKYRIDRMTENGVILRFHTVVNYFKLGINKYKLYLRLTNANKEKMEKIGRYFNHLPNTEWVALTTGRWDLIVGFLVGNVNELDDEVQKFLNEFHDFVQEKAITTTLYLAHRTRKFLGSNKKPEESIVYHTSKDKQETIDEVDDEILRILTNNARMPVTEIAQKLKITSRIVQYRIRELEKKKIILAFKVHLNPKAMGRIFCKAIIYLSNPTEEKLNNFMSYSSLIPGSVWPQRVMGDWDYELDLELTDYDEFQNVILDLKEKFSDIIINHDFCIVSKEYKLDFYPNSHREIR